MTAPMSEKSSAPFLDSLLLVKAWVPIRLWRRMRMTNENEQILVNLGETERTWRTGQKFAFLGKTVAKTGEIGQQTGKRN